MFKFVHDSTANPPPPPVFSWEIRRKNIAYFGKSSITSTLKTPTWSLPLNFLTKMLHTFLNFPMNYIRTNHTCSLYRVQIIKLYITYFPAFSCYFFISTNITLITCSHICAFTYRVGKSFYTHNTSIIVASYVLVYFYLHTGQRQTEQSGLNLISSNFIMHTV